MALRHESGDPTYVRRRHKLIPIADKRVREQFKGISMVTTFMRDRAFHRHMVILAIENGMSDHGNLTLFDAEKIPSGQFNPNL